MQHTHAYGVKVSTTHGRVHRVGIILGPANPGWYWCMFDPLPGDKSVRICAHATHELKFTN